MEHSSNGKVHGRNIIILNTQQTKTKGNRDCQDISGTITKQEQLRRDHINSIDSI